MFEECFCMFQNDLIKELLISILSRYFRLWQPASAPTKEIRLSIIWLAILNREEPKKKANIKVIAWDSLKKRNNFTISPYHGDIISVIEI